MRSNTVITDVFAIVLFSQVSGLAKIWHANISFVCVWFMNKVWPYVDIKIRKLANGWGFAKLRTHEISVMTVVKNYLVMNCTVIMVQLFMPLDKNRYKIKQLTRETAYKFITVLVCSKLYTCVYIIYIYIYNVYTVAQLHTP